MTDARQSVSRYWNTLRYLKPIQIADRVRRAIYRPYPVVSNSFTLRPRVAGWIEPARLDAMMHGPDEFEFLSVRRRILSTRDWNEESWPLLWRYHLHYFEDLNAAGFLSRSAWHQALMERWIAENPPLQGVGWDPYPTSLRMVNWIKWWLSGAVVSRDALNSGRLQLARVISRIEYHLLGNHLLENARALVFGGLFFEGYEADKWLHRGLGILAKQLPEQILGDGGHFERSPMYHQIVLTGLLDLFNVMKVYDRPECSGLAPHIENMLRWSALMRHPDGGIALFNDAAFHEAPIPQAVEDYAARLGIGLPSEASAAEQAVGVHLKSSGYLRVARGGCTAILNVGSVGPAYLPGHAHADTLSFELSTKGRRLIVDTGTSTYERGEIRSWQRGSAAHNTVIVNGQNSSDVWGGFRVARRARVLFSTLCSDEHSTRVAAAHDGYLRIPARAVHERRWEFSAEQLRIEDRIDGHGVADLELVFNIHPGFELSRTSSTTFVACSLDGAVAATIESPHELSAHIADFAYAPSFGTVQVGARIVASALLLLPCSLVTTIRFSPGSLAWP